MCEVEKIKVREAKQGARSSLSGRLEGIFKLLPSKPLLTDLKQYIYVGRYACTPCGKPV